VCTVLPIASEVEATPWRVETKRRDGGGGKLLEGTGMNECAVREHRKTKTTKTSTTRVIRFII
jgi:hypothetical protein